MTKSLKSGILFSAVVIAAVLAKLIISPLTSFILVSRAALLAKLVKSLKLLKSVVTGFNCQYLSSPIYQYLIHQPQILSKLNHLYFLENCDVSKPAAIFKSDFVAKLDKFNPTSNLLLLWLYGK